MTTKRDSLPASKQLELYKLDLVNAERAVESLPDIEKAQKLRVEQAQERLNQEQDQLKRIQNQEKSEATDRVKTLKAKVAELSKRTR